MHGLIIVGANRGLAVPKKGYLLALQNMRLARTLNPPQTCTKKRSFSGTGTLNQNVGEGLEPTATD